MDAAAWYEQQRAGLGKRFLDQVAVLLESIEEQPEAYPLHRCEVHQAKMHVFPYLLFFRIDATQLTAVAIIHAKRHPGRRPVD